MCPFPEEEMDVTVWAKNAGRTAELRCWGLYVAVWVQQQGGRVLLPLLCSAHSWEVASLAAIFTRVLQLYPVLQLWKLNWPLNLHNNFE